MTTQQPLKIEAGKFYRLRNGDKANALGETDETYPIIGYRFEDGKRVSATWKKDGRFPSIDEHHKFDIISEWLDLPKVDWSKMSASTEFVARDKFGAWFEFQAEPILSVEQGVWLRHNFDFIMYRIKPEHAPKFSGDWKNSKVRRPQ